MAAALPVYWVVPQYRFTNLGDLDPQYLRATQALCTVSHVSIFGTAWLIFLICRRHLRSSVPSSLVVSLLSYFFCGYLSKVGVDPIAVDDIQRIVADLRERGLGVLITDHNVRETLSITDRAYLMFNGRIHIEGPAQRLVDDPEARKLYLGLDFQL